MKHLHVLGRICGGGAAVELLLFTRLCNTCEACDHNCLAAWVTGSASQSPASAVLSCSHCQEPDEMTLRESRAASRAGLKCHNDLRLSRPATLCLHVNCCLSHQFF